MFPTLLEVPSVHWVISSYTTMIVFAVLVCHAVGPRWVCRLEGIDPAITRRALIVLGIAAFAGGRLHLVATYWDRFAEHPLTILKVWAGLHAGGAMTALALAVPLVCRRYGVAVGQLADGLAPTIGVGITIARLGCFLHGCCFGTICQLPWCLSFPRGSESHQYHVALGLLSPDAARSLPVHPLELYFAAAGLVLTVLAVSLYPRKRYDGQVALVAFAFFAVSSAGLEWLRADLPQRAYWGALPQLEWVALLMTGAALITLALAQVVHRRGVPVTDGPPSRLRADDHAWGARV